MGDGGGGGYRLGSSRDPSSLLGKLLRIDVYSTDDPDGDRPTTVSSTTPPTARNPRLGLRNPWKFSIDPDGGDIYIADVGQGDVEEVNCCAAAPAG